MFWHPEKHAHHTAHVLLSDSTPGGTAHLTSEQRVRVSNSAACACSSIRACRTALCACVWQACEVCLASEQHLLYASLRAQACPHSHTSLFSITEYRSLSRHVICANTSCSRPIPSVKVVFKHYLPGKWSAFSKVFLIKTSPARDLITSSALGHPASASPVASPLPVFRKAIRWTRSPQRSFDPWKFKCLVVLGVCTVQAVCTVLRDEVLCCSSRCMSQQVIQQARLLSSLEFLYH